MVRGGPLPSGAETVVGVTQSGRWTQGEGFRRATGDRINRREEVRGLKSLEGDRVSAWLPTSPGAMAAPVMNKTEARVPMLGAGGQQGGDSGWQLTPVKVTAATVRP